MTTRKNFLAAGTALAVLGAAAPNAAGPQMLSDFDTASTSDAPHKHAFASTDLAGGFILTAMRNTLNAYQELGIPEPEVYCVGVLYHHQAIALAFNDAMWKEYEIPYGLKYPKSSPAGIDFASVYDRKVRGNPLLHADSGRDNSIESLVASGSRFFVCDNALRSYASSVATQRQLPPTEVYSDLSKSLVRGAMIVPAGVWAVHALQERHFTLLQTSI
jgi:intracellular sulfur oxidation DsrE/DsrF family protein